MFALQKGKNINKGFVWESVKLIAWHLRFFTTCLGLQVYHYITAWCFCIPMSYLTQP